MKTLYLSDLDGTLLTPEKKISPESAALLNGMMERGLLFSVATARSMGTLPQILGPLRLSLPTALMNGVLIYDWGRERYVHVEALPRESAAGVVQVMERLGLGCYLFTLKDDILYANYRSLEQPCHQKFLAQRQGGGRKIFRRVASLAGAAAAEPCVFFSFSGPDPRPLREGLLLLQQVPGTAPVLYEDRDEHIWYLETCSARAGKASAMEWLKGFCGAQRTVAFGDNANDLDMLARADLSCAVANAAGPVRRAADRVIASNRENGVARFIAGDFKP
ncbi:MAG: HAD family hydrolase [Oscillospiraceae bacterium]|nr:HAD family hydrolase [Oscillospiraceae bacterium]